MDMYDTVIIGAGMSGLAAGIRLAYYDQRVCILERHTTIGGLNSFYRLGGRNYDVGLHAVTNFTPKGTRQGPLARILRQLRFRWEDFSLVPQIGSVIAFPGARLRFSNDFGLFESEVHRQFPAEKDNFRKLLANVLDYDDIGEQAQRQSARAAVAQWISDPLLTEMLFCPLMFYGSARENDMDFAQFCILFRSIFLEGLARPLAGVRLILKHLVRKFKQLGGDLCLRAGVRRIAAQHGAATRVVLDDGAEIEARQVLSSAGWQETMRMCASGRPAGQVESTASRPDPRQAGQLSFVESISILDSQPSQLGHDHTLVFFNDSEQFHWQKPDELVDVRSGVICSPNNFAYERPPAEGALRITALANFDRWHALSDEEYQQAKRQSYQRIVDSAVRFIPDFRPRVIDTDTFTPRTIRHFTGHDNGAVYGAPEKHWDGRTHLKNLFICGTDQGLIGIIGAMMSGISIANRYLLGNHEDSPPRHGEAEMKELAMNDE